MFHGLVYHPNIFHNISVVEMLVFCDISSFSVFIWLVIVTSFFLWFTAAFHKKKSVRESGLKSKIYFLYYIYLICINIDMVRLSFEKVVPKLFSSMGLWCIWRIQLLLLNYKCIHMHCIIPDNSQIVAFEILAVKIFSLTLVLQKFKFIILGILKTLRTVPELYQNGLEFHGSV